jgi:hypothetical protein
VREAFGRLAAVHPASLHIAHGEITAHAARTGFSTAPLRVRTTKLTYNFARVGCFHRVIAFAWGIQNTINDIISRDNENGCDYLLSGATSSGERTATMSKI